MSRLLRRPLTGLLAALLLLPTTGTAFAAEPRGAVEAVTTTPEGLEVRFRGVDLPAGAELDPASVVASLGGRPVPSTAEVAQVQPPGAETRRVMVVLDSSGSMAGERLPAALAAVRTYLDVVPADVEVGLVTFAADVAVTVPATTDRALVRAELDRIRPNGGTSLYDAVLAARSALGLDGERRLLVLSDGEDTDSTRTLPDVLAEMTGSDVAVDAVVLGDEPAAAAVLEQVTGVAGGRMLLAGDATTASAAFESAAKAFGARLLVRVEVPDELAGQAVPLELSATTNAGQIATAPIPVVLPALPVAAQVPRPEPPSVLALGLGLVTVFAGLAALLCLLVSAGDTRARQSSRTRAALSAYGSTKPAEGSVATPVPASALGSSRVIRTAVELAGRVVESRGLRERLELRLERAGIRLTPAEWLVVHVTAVTVTAAVGRLLTGQLLLAVLLAVTVGVLVQAVLHVKAKRRAAAFLAALPDALQLVASGLSSGYSLPQALDAAVREGEDPVATEFGRALAEARLGVPLDEALDTVAERMGSKDFSWVVMAVRIQKDVGGNLSEVLETLCKTLRERQALRRQVAALSAEGRLSAYVLIALPIFLGVWFAISRPEYFGVMFTSLLGIGMLAGSAVALVLGAVWMQKLVKVEM